MAWSAKERESMLADFLYSFRAHANGRNSALDVTIMRTLAMMKEHRSLVLVPDDYDFAYRLMWNVGPQHLAQVLGRAPDAEQVGACVSHAVEEDRVSSWTVSLDSLRPDRRRFISVMDEGRMAWTKRNYAVLVATTVHPRRGRARKFWLNPDEIYEAAGQSDFVDEREVVSVGSVGPVWMSYVRARDDDDDRTWGDLLNWLVEQAEDKEREIAACGRRRAVR